MARRKALRDLERWLEVPMLMLSLVWLALLIVESMWGAGPMLEGIGILIWVVFIAEASVRLLLAPHKTAYFKKNWLTILALAVPALRIFRVARLVRLFRLTRAARGMTLVRLVSSLNRGVHALGAGMGRRGLGYVLTVTVLVMLTGSVGMYVFERESAVQDSPAPSQRSPGLNDYGTALWWTAMIMTTMGSDYWPRTPEGRILCVILALYAFAMFGYITASLASYFIGQSTGRYPAEAEAQSIEQLRSDIAYLRNELRTVLHKLDQP